MGPLLFQSYPVCDIPTRRDETRDLHGAVEQGSDGFFFVEECTILAAVDERFLEYAARKNGVPQVPEECLVVVIRLDQGW
ncbi:hypothetical protein SDC9_166307 [bioreactor metagenome]|uniref:Uncharacterized protein n=1 Tax=bioreactor metagenome TaxID=1076179 RepID=A0A645FZ04_9ZZZZ